MASLAVVFIAWWPSPLVFGIKLACMLEDPTVSVGMISWLIRVTVNLTRSVQYPVKGGWSVLFGLKWLLPLTGFRIVKSGVDCYVTQSFVIAATAMLVYSWLAVAVSDFGSARVAGVVAFTSEPVIFPRTKVSH